MKTSILDYLDNSVKKYAEKTAFVDVSESVTYKEFQQAAMEVASWIIKKISVTRQPIMVKMKNSIDALIAFWGVTYSGNIYVPIDSKLPYEREQQIINTVKPCLIITTEEKPLEGEVTLQEIMKEAFIDEKLLSAIRRNVTDVDPLYILFTSGSTGVPKGVVISHRAVIDFVEEASEYMQFDEKEKFLNQAPFYFDASVPDIFCTVRNGAELHIVPKTWFAFPIKLMDYIEKNKITAIYWVPSALVGAANMKALGKRDISSLKKVMFCGEVMPTKQYNIWKKALPDARYINYYGPCETTYASLYYEIDREFDDMDPLPIGHAAKNTKVLLLDTETRKEVKNGEVGEIYIGGSGVSLGYYGDVDRTDAAFVQNPEQKLYHEILYKTGDLAHYGEDGNLYFDGRADNQIKHMGYRIELEEIESIARGISGISMVACVYSAKYKEIVLYYAGDVDEEQIKMTLKDKLQFYMIPGSYCKRDNFPMSANGKINRIRLLEEYDQQER